MGDASELFTPYRLGDLTLPNRVVMAPMTRLRAPDGMPTALMAEYYMQRSSAGLIITECSMVSDTAAAYMNAPGIYADRFIPAWRTVTEGIHEAGGRVYLQLWHPGRVGHVSLQPDGRPPLAPSAVAGVGELYTPTGKQPLSMPRAMSVEEIEGLTRAFGKAAARARAAGFDGVELHGAYGYLIDQFLQDGSNHRTDMFGGPPENRARFLLKLISACQQVFGQNVGVKLSPSNRSYGMSDSDPEGLFGHVLNELNEADLAYVHMMEPFAVDREAGCRIDPVLPFARTHYRGTIIANGGFDRDSADAALGSRSASLISFGQAYVANPDLVARLRGRAELVVPDYSTVYWTPDQPPERGYTDYPPMTPA